MPPEIAEPMAGVRSDAGSPATERSVMSAREKILDAYESVIADQGERGATLELIAQQAGVSKGGLLYHFGSKDALAAGLLQRLDERVDADLDLMRASEEGPSAFYVRTSLFTGSPLDHTLVAVARLSAEAHPEASAALARSRDRWLELIAEEVGDRARAHAILLIGDGLYYEAAYRGEREESPAAEMESLLRVVAELARR